MGALGGQYPHLFWNSHRQYLSFVQDIVLDYLLCDVAVMTDHERAEKIREIIARWNIEQIDEEEMIRQITAQLDEVVRDEWSIGRNKGWHEGFAAAIVKAAGMVSETCSGKHHDDIPEGGVCFIHTLAERIRSLRPDGEK